MRLERIKDLFMRRITPYEFFSGSKTLKNIMDIKNIFEIGTMPINFITSKLPLLSSLLLFWVYWSKIKEQPIIILYVFCAFWVVYVIGRLWKGGGFYRAERVSETNLDPVAQEIYNAAKIINEKWGRK